jgi:hypothetical protein
MEQQQYFTAVRGGEQVVRITKAEEKYRTVTEVQTIEPLDAAGFKRVFEAIRKDASGRAAAVLAYAAACYLKPKLNASGIALRHLTVCGNADGNESAALKRLAKAIFATPTELSAQEATLTRIMYHTSSTDYVPLVISGYDNRTAGTQRRRDIVNGMRSAFNKLGCTIGQSDLTVRRYCAVSPCVLFCVNPPVDRGLRWRSIRIEIPEFYEITPSDTENISAADLRSFGAALYKTALMLPERDVTSIHSSSQNYHTEYGKLGHLEAEQAADLSTGLWLIAKAVEAAGTEFVEAFGETIDEVDARVITAVTFDGIA